jgi:pyruvate/2-oxoglutarate/acetoin dehydrogenase E1 component
VIRNNFDKIFEKYPETLVFGEDAGNIGDVNQGLEGMQEKYGAFVLLIQEFVKQQFLDKELVWR